MRNYEMMIITVPDMGAEGIEELKTKVSDVLAKEENGVLDTFDVWKEKHRMSFTMRSRGAEKRKYDDGTYLLVNYKMNPRKLKDLKYVLDLDERILRYMNISKGDA